MMISVVIVVSASESKRRQKTTLIFLRLVRRNAQNKCCTAWHCTTIAGNPPKTLGPARNTSWVGGGDICMPVNKTSVVSHVLDTVFVYCHGRAYLEPACPTRVHRAAYNDNTFLHRTVFRTQLDLLLFNMTTFHLFDQSFGDPTTAALLTFVLDRYSKVALLQYMTLQPHTMYCY